MKTQFFSGCQSLEEVKKCYKKLAMLYHPDRGGDTATMQQINNEYATIIQNPHFKCEEQTREQQEDSLRYPEIIDQLINLEGIFIEIIGDWIWLSGNTYPHRAIIKQIGFFFAPKKIMWYYRPSDYKSSNKNPKSIDEIRNKYGSNIIESNNKTHQLYL